ncbi:MAG: polysaccharide deacetylase family protein [Acidimicrobiales bacterium]
MRQAGRTIGSCFGWAAASVLAAQYAPSVVALGQWTPLEALPGERCRWQGPRERPGVALTFDDGPHPEGTPAILDRLDDLGLRATFFPLGSAVQRYPALVDEVVRRGHLVGTHGYRHAHHLARTPAWVRRDLSRAGEVMGAGGHRPSWYRPAFGQVTAATLAAARRMGWRTVLWSAWGREWATSDPGAVAARISRRLQAGAVVLLHDSDAFGPPGMWRTALRSLDRVAAQLATRGLAAVTLDELVR